MKWGILLLLLAFYKVNLVSRHCLQKKYPDDTLHNRLKAFYWLQSCAADNLYESKTVSIYVIASCDTFPTIISIGFLGGKTKEEMKNI